MKYTYEINSDTKTINVTTIGDLRTTDMATMELEIRMKAKEMKYKIIYDHR